MHENYEFSACQKSWIFNMRWMVFILFCFYANAFAVSPSVIDFGDVKMNEEKKSGFYVFNTDKKNLSLVLEYVGVESVSFDNNFVYFDDDKEFVSVRLNVPSGIVKGIYEGDIFVKEKSDSGRISLSKGYVIDVLYNVVDGFFVRNETVVRNEFDKGGLIFVKSDVGEIVKISSLFENENDEDYFVLKGEVFVDDSFYTILHSDIILLKKGEKKLINTYFKPEAAGKYDIHLKVVGEDYESEEKKVSFIIEEKSFFDRFDRNSLIFVGLCCVVGLLGLVNALRFLK